MVEVPETSTEKATQELQQKSADDNPQSREPDLRQTADAGQDAILHELLQELEEGTGQEAADEEDRAQQNTPQDRRCPVEPAVEACEPPSYVAPEEERDKEYEADNH